VFAFYYYIIINKLQEKCDFPIHISINIKKMNGNTGRNVATIIIAFSRDEEIILVK